MVLAAGRDGDSVAALKTNIRTNREAIDNACHSGLHGVVTKG